MCLCHSPSRHHLLARGPLFGRRHMLGLLGGVAAAPLLGACDEGDGFPVQLVPEETVQQLGLESWQRIREQTQPTSDPGLQQTLDRVGRQLLAAAGEDPANWEMVVFAGDDVNAFALPGGKIGVFEGMFNVAESADQLAAVVGHEIGHVQAEHSQERLSAAVAKDLGLRLISSALQIGDIQYANEIAALLGAGAEFGLVLPYSRQQELEADRLGLFTMAEAGFDPRAAVTLWERMDAMAGGQRTPAFLSTHPAPTDRIEALEALLPEALRIAEQAG